MMSADFLTLCDAIAEKCRCSICKGYLSCSPIRMLPDGRKCCGCCSPPDVPTTRDSVLEDSLNSISFPCRFRNERCTERSLFGQVLSHENKCYYQIFSCLETECNWKGTALTFFDHFNKEHKELVKEKAEIKLQLAENTDGTLIFKEGCIFAIRYLYDCDNRNLSYCIAYNSYDIESDIAFEITLISGSDSDVSITSKQTNLVCFENNRLLDLNKYCELLNNPDSIVIVFNLIVTQANLIVQKLDLPTCNKCYNYLIPPLFMIEDKLVCYECGERDSPNTPSHNQELSQLLKQIDFPCYYRNCSFTGKYDVYKIHKIRCQRLTCDWTRCGSDRIFKFSAIIDHFKIFHKAIYFVDNVVQKISFSGEYTYTCHYTIRSGYYLILQQLWGTLDECDKYSLRFNSYSQKDGRPSNSNAIFFFEHQHCRKKSKLFKISTYATLDVTLAELPPCFKDNHNEITVTVAIE